MLIADLAANHLQWLQVRTKSLRLSLAETTVTPKLTGRNYSDDETRTYRTKHRHYSKNENGQPAGAARRVSFCGIGPLSNPLFR
jgi:hypothetical protein